MHLQLKVKHPKYYKHTMYSLFCSKQVELKAKLDTFLTLILISFSYWFYQLKQEKKPLKSTKGPRGFCDLKPL